MFGQFPSAFGLKASSKGAPPRLLQTAPAPKFVKANASIAFRYEIHEKLSTSMYL